MKEELKVLLNELGHKVQDFGAYSEEAVDYPDFAHAVARAVANGSCGSRDCDRRRGCWQRDDGEQGSGCSRRGLLLG